eukprot:TRINITY_DN3593_c0_g1_i1.p1 TRINITY_DN3593_c0_g1~~TRINITY_DN3593_c0_g1_i1.p1  ORF type:complete len:213 (+),score=26.98 TRINITY_DN3593_c0_g1_i1:51-689(+)
MAMLPPHLGIFMECDKPVKPKIVRHVRDSTSFNKSCRRLQGWQWCRYVGKYVPFPSDAPKSEGIRTHVPKEPPAKRIVPMSKKSSKPAKKRTKKKCLVFDTHDGRKMISPVPVKISLSPSRQPPKSPPPAPRHSISRPEPVSSSPRRSRFPYIALLDASAQQPYPYLNTLCSSSSYACQCARFSALPYLKTLSDLASENKECGTYLGSLLLC